MVVGRGVGARGAGVEVAWGGFAEGVEGGDLWGCHFWKEGW